ncbi:hypothetical protein DXG01_006053 [Tephrocybe rancida]|nr:hypothetical protein DXG01_006053 [Tephrocybe rancida]
MAQSTVKSKCPIVHSDAESSEDEQPAKKQQKQASKLSKKVTETDKENLKKAAAEIAKLKKKMKKLESQNIDDEESMEGDNDEDIESEDEEHLGFSSSIWPLERTNEPAHTPIHRSTACRPSQLTSVVNQTPLHRHADLDNEGNNDQQATIPLNIVGGFVAVGGSVGAPANDDQPSSDSKPEASALLLARLCNGVKLTAAPAVNDYADPIVRSHLLGSIRKYEAHVAGRHAFPSLAVQVTWATDAWKEVQDERNEKIGDMDAP